MAPAKTIDAYFISRGNTSTIGPRAIQKRTSAPAQKPRQPAQKSRQPAAADASNRVESDVLLAILPTHLRNIASRQKNHEYRKYRLKDGVERLWLYETRGTRADPGRGAITHIATIPPTTRHTPGSVPEEPPGIGNTDFNAGRKESKYGYPILELYELARPVQQAEMKSSFGLSAPMGWSYLRKDLWADRWGDEGREERLKQIF